MASSLNRCSELYDIHIRIFIETAFLRLECFHVISHYFIVYQARTIKQGFYKRTPKMESVRERSITQSKVIYTETVEYEQILRCSAQWDKTEAHRIRPY